MEDNWFKRNKRYRQSIHAHEYRKNKDFAVGHKAFIYRFSNGLPIDLVKMILFMRRKFQKNIF